jgi:hypothetical protein
VHHSVLRNKIEIIILIKLFWKELEDIRLFQSNLKKKVWIINNYLINLVPIRLLMKVSRKLS